MMVSINYNNVDFFISRPTVLCSIVPMRRGETSQDGTDRWCTDCEIRPKDGDNERRRRARLEMFYKFHYALVSISSNYLPKPPNSIELQKEQHLQLRHPILQDTV